MISCLAAGLLAVLSLVDASPAQETGAQTTQAWEPGPEELELLAHFEFIADEFLTSDGDVGDVETLTRTFPEVVRLRARSATSAEAYQVGHVAWLLVYRGGEDVEAVLANLPRLRSLLSRAGHAGLGAGLDEQLALELVIQGRHGAAEEVLGGALEAWPEAELTLLAARGNLYRQQQQWGAATSDLDRAEALLEDLPFDQNWVTYIQLGRARSQLELALGRLDFSARALERASDALSRAAALSASVPVREWELLLSQARADHDLTAGYHDLVVQALEPLLNGAPQDQQPYLTLRAQLALAFAGLELEDPDRPRRSGPLLGELFRHPALPVGVRLKLGLRLATGHLTSGDLDACAALLPEIEALLEEWDRESPGAPPTLQRAVFRMLESRLARLRGADLETLSARLEALEAVQRDLLAVWAATPVFPGGLGFLQWGPRREVLSELLTLRALVDPRGAEAALDDLLRAEVQGSLARRLELPVPNLEEIRAALIDGGGILVIVPSVRGGSLFAIDGEQVEIWELPGSLDLERLAAEASRAAYAPGHAATTELRNAVLRPGVAQRLAQWDHLYLVGLSELRGVRFEALPLGAGAGAESIARSMPVARLPSLPVGVWLAREPVEPALATPSALALWVAAQPSEAAREQSPQLVTIPFGDADRERLRAPFGGQALDAIRATPEVLRDADLGGAVVLHLLCHGLWLNGEARPAALVLEPSETHAGESEDGVVDCAFVENPTRPYPPLVILSACDAALGPRRLGDDGVSHLGGAFFAGGARTILLADGELSYRATVRLSESFHRSLAQGQSPAEALRLARGDLDEELPLRLLGIAHRPLFRRPEGADSGPPWALSAGGIALLLLAAILVRRKRAPRGTH